MGQSAAALVTNFTCDTQRRLTTINYPDVTLETWTYNAPGLSGPHQPDTFTNRVGHKTTYGYTGGQRTSETLRNSANVFMEETLLGNIAFVTTEYSNAVLDGNGLPTGLGDTVKTEFLTTALGDVRRMTLPDPDGAGSLVRPVYEYSLDVLGRILTSVEPGPETVAERTTTIDWNDFGELKTVDLPDPDGGTGSLVGSRVTYTYDLIGFPTSVKTSAIGGAVVKSEFFQFNSRGELEWQSLPGVAKGDILLLR